MRDLAMPTFRFYFNKTEGNDLSRVVDVGARDVAAARAAAVAAADETLDQVVTLGTGDDSIVYELRDEIASLETQVLALGGVIDGG